MEVDCYIAAQIRKLSARCLANSAGGAGHESKLSLDFCHFLCLYNKLDSENGKSTDDSMTSLPRRCLVFVFGKWHPWLSSQTVTHPGEPVVPLNCFCGGLWRIKNDITHIDNRTRKVAGPRNQKLFRRHRKVPVQRKATAAYWERTSQQRHRRVSHIASNPPHLPKSILQSPSITP